MDKRLDPSAQPACPYTAQCLRLFDDITTQSAASRGRPIQRHAASADPQEQADARLVAQLSAHIPTCPTCSSAMERERQRREQQRRALREILAEGEVLVPSTTASIMAAIRHEAQTASTRRSFQEQDQPTLVNLPSSGGTITPSRARRRLSTIFTLVAAAAVILLCLGLVTQLLQLRGAHPNTGHIGTTPTPTPAPIAVQLTPSKNWSSVVIVHPSPNGQQQIIENYNPVTGSHTPLLLNCCPSDTVVDGVTHKGTNLIYHNYDGHNTIYHLLSGDTYVLHGQGTSAVWKTDDSAFYVYSTSDGLVQITLQNHVMQKLPYPLNATNLVFYRDDFLYFTYNRTSDGTDLYRLDLNEQRNRGMQNFIASGLASTSFWLDPLGNFIYAVQKTDGGYAITTTNSDGSRIAATDSANITRKGAIPIGYVQNQDGSYSLVVVQQDGAKFTVIKVGDGAQVPDTTILDDIAPGGKTLCSSTPPTSDLPLCDSSIAFSPMGDMLVVGASSDDGHYRVWSNNVQTQNRIQLLDMTGYTSTHIQLVGWDKLLTP